MIAGLQEHVLIPVLFALGLPVQGSQEIPVLPHVTVLVCRSWPAGRPNLETEAGVGCRAHMHCQEYRLPGSIIGCWEVKMLSAQDHRKSQVRLAVQQTWWLVRPAPTALSAVGYGNCSCLPLPGSLKLT